MAESNDSFHQFDSIQLDENKNPPESENHLLIDAIKYEQSSPKHENVTLNGVISESSVCGTPVFDYSSMPEVSTQLNTDILKSNNPDIINNSSDGSDSGIHDSENNIIESSKLIDFSSVDLDLSNGTGVVISDFKNENNEVQVKDEEFHDAVQFFKDPTSLIFLENAGTSNTSDDTQISRSSLYMNFDPLHAKFFSQPSVKHSELEEIVETELEPTIHEADAESSNVPSLINKHLVNGSIKESLGNVLISFDSPVGGKSESVLVKNNSEEPPKLYTEDELQQALKIQELTVQETFLKRQHDLELDRTRKQKEEEDIIQQQNVLCSSFHEIIKELLNIIFTLSDNQKLSKENLEEVKMENSKLKDDLKTSVEDLQSVESTFSDFHKRYEQCKSMLKVYTQNEDNLKQQLENMKVKLHEQEEMYKVLQSRTQEMLDKANTEVANAKKGGDAQVAVLKAQLKKAELKISSLESDVKHVKIENGKLSSICDELMAKVSET